MKGTASVLALLSITNCPDANANPPKHKDPLKGLDFLVGEWHADPPSRGSDMFRRDLDGKVIVRSAQADTANVGKAVTMKMAMTMYSERGSGLGAIYFDNDGHVIHYKVSALEGMDKRVVH